MKNLCPKTVLSIFLLFSLISLSACRKSESPLSPIQAEGKWELISDAGYGFGFGKIFFTDRQNGWIIGDSGKVKCTHDGGLTWVDQLSGTKAYLGCIYFFDRNTGVIGGNSRTLLYTSNGGADWNPVFETPDDKAFIAGLNYSENILWLSDRYGKIYSSTDLGKNWHLKFNILPRIGFSYFKTFGNTVFAFMNWDHELTKSTDGGGTWKRYTLPVWWSSNMFFLNEKLGWATENNQPNSFHHDSASCVFSTSDGGETWRKIFAITGDETNHVYFSDANTGWFSCISENLDTVIIYHTTDGGKNFNVQYQYANKTTDMMSDLFFLDANNAWGLTFYGKIIRYSVK